LGVLKKAALGAVAGAGAVFYARAMLARNRRLVRPRIEDAAGRELPVSRFRFSGGEEVEYIDVGPGVAAIPGSTKARAPTLVWVPGADGPKETFRYQLPHFARSHRVICADLRIRITPEHVFDRFADDLDELLTALQPGPMVIIGQSLGSAIALRFADRFPDDVRGLVLANPVARLTYEHVGLNRTGLTPVAQGTTRYLPTALSYGVARAVWSPLGVWIYDDSSGREALIDYAHDTGPRTTPSRVSAARVGLLKGHDLRDGLWRLDVPVLVVKGPGDVYCPVSWALEIADRLPDARYVPILGTGHCSHISRPAAFNQAIEVWLRELDGRDE
jgi:pimeloyl-ACP methyl ester carboxylesterase